MARLARQHSESGVYHVMLRGIDQAQLFYDTEDRLRFLEKLQNLRTTGSFRLYAYVLMGNHVHLLIQESTDDLARAMKRLAVSYARWFNAKYDRTGLAGS